MTSDKVEEPSYPDGRGILASPVRLLLIIGLSIFVSEAVVMLVISHLPSHSALGEALLDATMLIVLVTPTLYFSLFRPLLLYIEEYKQIENALHKVKDELEEKVVERTAEFQKANEQLTIWAKELEQYNQEGKLLAQMTDLLQTCNTSGEAYAIITKTMSRLFPADSGALFIFKSSRNLLETLAVFGNHPPRIPMLAPDECWALRRGQAHVVADVSSGILCPHFQDRAAVAYMCIPMMAHGETLGVLHLEIGQTEGRHLEAKQRLLENVAERMSLALSNLKLRETLRSLSIRDPLTGLFNRRYMEEFFEREIYNAERKGIPLGVIMFDIDHFKQFNDTFGHSAGDTVLRELGMLLQKHVRKSDIACRYGGEEFILVLPEMSSEMVRQRAEELREGVRHLRLVHEQQPLGTITISLGVALFPAHGLTAEAVIKAADSALYQAKHEGRDRVCMAG